MLIELPDTKLGKNIFVLRKKYYLSRRALASLTGISEYTLRDWEEEWCNPIITWEQLKRIAVILIFPQSSL